MEDGCRGQAPSTLARQQVGPGETWWGTQGGQPPFSPRGGTEA